jgi:CHAT domain-containing protein
VAGHIAPLGREALAQRVLAARAALQGPDGARGIRALPASRQAPSPGAAAAVAVAVARKADAPAASASFDTLSTALARELLAPVLSQLPADGQLIAIEPHESLWQLPFAALRLPDGRWMAERWPLLYAPSAELLDQARRRPTRDRNAPASALIIGNPIVAPQAAEVDALFRVGLDPLPGAEEEARRIAAMFGSGQATLWRGAEGNLPAVLREAPSRDIVHLASHGIARGDAPLESFIALAPSVCGDRLSAKRVMTLNLRADLVVLSACQTGLGQVTAEGVLGLARSFTFAGARTVLVSHWSVSDQATTRLMTGFYAHHLRGGADKARALHRSMGDLRREPGFEDPRYWAPFFLVGAE